MLSHTQTHTQQQPSSDFEERIIYVCVCVCFLHKLVKGKEKGLKIGIIKKMSTHSNQFYWYHGTQGSRGNKWVVTLYILQ